MSQQQLTSAALTPNSGHQSHRQLQQPVYQQAVMGQRLKKQQAQHWASARELVTEPDIRSHGNVVDQPGTTAAVDKKNRQGQSSKAWPDDCPTTIKKQDSCKALGESSSKKASLQSARMRHLQTNQPHSYITSDEKHIASESGSQKSERGIPVQRKSQRTNLPGFKNVVKFGNRNRQIGDQQSHSQQRHQQISSARNNISKESMTPALLHGSNNYNSAKSQLVLEKLHGTKSGAGVPIGQNYRYHSQQISKVRQRPSNADFNYNSASSTEETNPSFLATNAVHHTGTGRLIFKRQEKNQVVAAGSGALQQPRVAAAMYHPAPAGDRHSGFSKVSSSGYTGQSVAQSLDNPNFKKPQQQFQATGAAGACVGDDGILVNFNMPPQTTSKVYLGDNKRESTLQKGYLASPRSDEQQRFRARVTNINSQMSFDIDRFHNNYQSVEELRSVGALQQNKGGGNGAISGERGSTSTKNQRSLRRIKNNDFPSQSSTEALPAPPSGAHKATTGYNGNTNKLTTQQRISRKLVERIGSQQAIADQMIMNIREEFSVMKEQDSGEKSHRGQQYPITNSMQALSTKQFLESGSIDTKGAIPRTQTRNQQKVDHSSQQNADAIVGGHQASLSFDNQRHQRTHQRNHPGGALHQHSSSVLPSHRNFHLLSSVNALPPKEVPNSLQHYKGGPQEEEKITNIYNSAQVISRPSHNSGSQVNLYLGDPQPQGHPNNGGSKRYASFISGPNAPEVVSNEAKLLKQQEAGNYRYKNQSRRKMTGGAPDSGTSSVTKGPHYRQSSQETPATEPSVEQVPTTTQASSNIFVSKVSQKNQQFKFQFRRKSQQNNNYKRSQQQQQASNRVTNPNTTSQRTPAETVQQATQTGSDQQTRPFKSQRVSISRKVSNLNKVHATYLQEQTRDGDQQLLQQDDVSSSKFVVTKSDAIVDGHQKKRRNQKLLSSASPPQSRFSKNGKGAKPLYMIASNGSSAVGSDFEQRIANGKSRGRLQSVAIQPSSFSKRLSDNNDKMITSSQNSGGNISGLTLVNPQKPPNTPMKQSMQSMHQNFSTTNTAKPAQGDENTTQKPKHNRATVYENLRTKKRHADKQLSSEPRSDNQTTTRTHKRVTYIIKPGSGTTSHDGSSSDQNQALTGGQSTGLPKISQSSKEVPFGSSDHIDKSPTIGMTVTNQSGAGNTNKVVTSYTDQTKKRDLSDQFTDPKSQQHYIVRQSGTTRAAQQLNGGVYEDLVQLKTVDTQMQSFSLVNEDGVTQSDFNGQNSLHSAQNIAKTYDDQLNSIESGKCLSKTSSLNHFKNKLTIKPLTKIQVISDEQSASEISKLQQQIKERDQAYSSLKTQFEQLRNQLGNQKRNASEEKVVSANENKYFKSGQVDCIQSSEDDGSLTTEQNVLGTVKSRAERLNEKVRTSLHNLKLIKQRSNSEAHLQNALKNGPRIGVKDCHQNQIVSEQVSDGDGNYLSIVPHGQSKLKQPTKFSSKSKQVSRQASKVRITQDRSAPSIAIASPSKPSGRKNQNTLDKKSQLSKEDGGAFQKSRGSLPANLDGRSSRNAKSNDSVRYAARAVAPQKDDSAVYKNMTSLVQKQQQRVNAPQKQRKGATQAHSVISLVDKERKGAKSSRQHNAVVAVNQSKKLQEVQQIAKQQQQPVKKAISKAKTTSQKNQNEITLSQTNKLAIQNLKQAINSNSTGKKATGKGTGGLQAKRNRATLAGEAQQVQQQPSTKVAIPEEFSIDAVDNQDLELNNSSMMMMEVQQDQQKAIYRTQDTMRVVEQQENLAGDCALEVDQRRTVMQQSQAAAFTGTKFTCSGKPQDSRVETEPVLEASVIQRQESIYKEETPSNEQSQNSSPPVPHFIQPVVAPQLPLQQQIQRQPTEHEFKATGTAFGQNAVGSPGLKQNLGILARQAAESSRQVNCFGIVVKGQGEESRVDCSQEQSQNFPNQQSSAIFPINVDISQQQMSQQSAAFANGAQPSKQQSSVVQLSSQATDLSRCETPIHPGQEIDGIKFFQVEDPDYKSSDVFNHCQDGDGDIPTINDGESQQNVRASTPIMPLNSTGKEFFAAKKKQQQQVAEQQAAVQIQKSSIQILKQLQKKKQAVGAGVVGGQQRARAQHPKVVISQNNPFFIRPNATKSSNVSGHTKSSGEFTNAIQVDQNSYSQVQMVQQPQFGTGISLQPQQLNRPDQVVEFTAIGMPNTSIKYSKIQQSQTKTHNSSMVSHDMFYSPIQRQDESPLGGAQDEERKEGLAPEAEEIVSQSSITKAKAQAHIQQRMSEAAAQFGAVEDNSCFQVSAIEQVGHNKRDEILDDSLLFALVADDGTVPRNKVHLLEDSGHNFQLIDCMEAEENASDTNFFAKQMSFQPEVLETQITGEVDLQKKHHYEESNFKDLMPTVSNFCVGDGLILEARQSSVSSEMAALDGGSNEVSPGKKKSQLDRHHHHLPMEESKTPNAQIVSGTLYPRTTDKKLQLGELATARESTVLQKDSGLNMNIISGSKATTTEMGLLMSSGAGNLTYSVSPSAINSASISEWTGQKITLASKEKQHQQ